MKVIDLLNKLANNEEVPKKIKFGMAIYELTEKLRYEDIEDKKIFEQRFIFESLNDEIEIIEEKPKKIEEIKKRYDKQAITNYKQANFNSTDMKEICKTIGFLMQYLDEARDTINYLTKAVNYLLEKESDK